MTTRSAKDRKNPRWVSPTREPHKKSIRHGDRLFWFVLPGFVSRHETSAGNQANRAISTSKLNALLRLHIWPIDGVVFPGSQAKPGFEVSFPLRCFQRLSRPYLATRLCHWRDNRSTRGTFFPVLSY